MLITNPYATSTTPGVHTAFTGRLSLRHEIDTVPTTHRGHATELGARAAAEGYDAVVVHGGDGSVNETVNGLLGPPDRTARPDPGSLPVLGVIPGGNANVFARALGFDRSAQRAVGQLVRILDADQRRTISLGHTLNRWFLFNAGMGMDATVIRRMEEQREQGRKVTNLRYLTTAVTSFLFPSHPSPTFTVEIPDHAPVTGARFAFVSNTSPWTYLGTRALRTNPHTDFDHGLGLAAGTSLSVARTIALGAQLLTDNPDPHGANLYREDDVDWVRFRSGEPAEVQMDGDYLGRYRELDFAGVRDALTVFAPASPDTHRSGGRTGR